MGWRMVPNVTALGYAYMVEQLEGLIPRLKVERARIIVRMPDLIGEHYEKGDPLEKREKDGSSQGTFLDQRGNLFGQLL